MAERDAPCGPAAAAAPGVGVGASSSTRRRRGRAPTRASAPATRRGSANPRGRRTRSDGAGHDRFRRATVKDVSSALGESLQKIMKFLMEAGEMVNITQSLSDEAIELIAAEFAPDRELRIKHADDEDDLEPEVYEDDPADLTERPPV